MKEIGGNLWDHLGEAIVCITTGGMVSHSGECFMPRGCARQAKDRFPGLAKKLGGLIRESGNHVHDLGHGVVSFPVEETPFEVPGLGLIERSCAELCALADEKGWSRVIVPRPGCGGGGLQWSEVRPVLAKHFNERFAVISDSGAGEGTTP